MTTLKVVPMKPESTVSDFLIAAQEHEEEARECRAKAHQPHVAEADFADLMAAASALDATAARYRRLIARGNQL